MNSQTYFVSPGTFGNRRAPSCGGWTGWAGSADAAAMPSELTKNSRRFMRGFPPREFLATDYADLADFNPCNPWLFLMNCHGRNSGSRRAFQFQRLQDKREFVHAFCREFIQLQAFQYMDAVDREKNLVHRRTDFGIGIRIHFNRPVVRTDKHRVLLRKPFG